MYEQDELSIMYGWVLEWGELHISMWEWILWQQRNQKLLTL